MAHTSRFGMSVLRTVCVTAAFSHASIVNFWPGLSSLPDNVREAPSGFTSPEVKSP